MTTTDIISANDNNVDNTTVFQVTVDGELIDVTSPIFTELTDVLWFNLHSNIQGDFDVKLYPTCGYPLLLVKVEDMNNQALKLTDMSTCINLVSKWLETFNNYLYYQLSAEDIGIDQIISVTICRSDDKATIIASDNFKLTEK